VFIRDLSRLLRFHLLAKRIEVALDSVHADRERIDDRKVLRVLRKNRREFALERQIVADKNAEADRQPQTHRTVIAVSNYVLVAIVRKRLGLEKSLYQILQVLSLTLFEKVPILQVFEAPNSTSELLPDPNQLVLFDI
jgi:hypothetical protein